jgi:epoxyqueuosine reductase
VRSGIPAKDIAHKLYARLAQENLRARFVPIHHLQEIRDDLKEKHRQGLFDQRFYDEWIKTLIGNLSGDYSGAHSLIIVAVPQPQYRVRFNWRGESYAFIIPPTYFYHMDEPAKKSIQELLASNGYTLSEADLPKKLLTVRSGLGRYGRNNLCYVQDLGTYHRLLAFATDMVCLEDRWQDVLMLDECRSCTACRHACPTGAISDERFLLHAELCITFHNESERDFPDWLRPEWHNSLVGCMLCQKVCPVNKPVVDWIEDTCEFTEKETAQIIDKIPVEQFSPHTVQKLKDIFFDGFISSFGRNLRALLSNKGVLNR